MKQVPVKQVPGTCFTLLPSGVAKWWLRDGIVEAMESPFTYANAHAQGVQDLSVECGSKYSESAFWLKPPRGCSLRKCSVSEQLSRVQDSCIRSCISYSRVCISCILSCISCIFRKDLTSLPEISQITNLQRLTSLLKSLIPTIIPTLSLTLSLPTHWISGVWLPPYGRDQVGMMVGIVVGIEMSSNS